MSELSDALSRLTAAIDDLDTVLSRKLASERSHGDLIDELELMREDRLKLAALLDESLAHRRTLETTVGQVNERIDRAIKTVRDVIDQRA